MACEMTLTKGNRALERGNTVASTLSSSSYFEYNRYASILNLKHAF